MASIWEATSARPNDVVETRRPVYLTWTSVGRYRAGALGAVPGGVCPTSEA